MVMSPDLQEENVFDIFYNLYKEKERVQSYTARPDAWRLKSE